MAVNLNDLIKFAYPAARPLIDYSLGDKNDGAGPFITIWKTAVLGPQPTLASLEANRTTVQAAADAADAAELADRNQIAQILAMADDMINGVGTTTQRQVRVETALGRLLKRLAKTGKIP